jgi:hypothetical protein
MRDTIEIARGFCGPPGSGNGGYVAGLLAGAASWRGPVKVRLRRPPPLETVLAVRRTATAAGGVELVHDGEILASAEPGALRSLPPRWTSFEVATNLSRSFPGFQRHPFPRCFVCGPERAAGDGLRIFPGPWHPGHAVAPWVPHRGLDRGDGRVAPEHVWAALDCPGYFAAASDGRPMLLGEFTARLGRAVRIGEPCVVVAWRIAAEGRKHRAGTAIHGEDGQLCGIAEALWIEPRPPAQSSDPNASSSSDITARAA